MKRRDFLKNSAVGAGVAAGTGVLASCSSGSDSALEADLAAANGRVEQLEAALADQQAGAPVIGKGLMEVAMVSTWPRDFPGLGTGAQRFAADRESTRLNSSHIIPSRMPSSA